MLSAMERERAIAKICARLPVKERRSDFAYWQTQPHEARLAALEEIRQEYHRWKYGAEPGFQRVHTIAQRQ